MKNKFLFVLLFGIFLVLPLVSAGVGISWDKETSLIPENTKTCLTYKIYNPWEEVSYIRIELSEDLVGIMSSTNSDVKEIPAQTSSSEAIPVNFCFKTPKTYEKDCALFNTFLCKQECLEEMKIYEGEVQVIEVPKPIKDNNGAGGSATAMSVGAPLRVKVQCIESPTNYSLIYLVVLIIAGVLLIMNLLRGRKSKGKKKK